MPLLLNLKNYSLGTFFKYFGSAESVTSLIPGGGGGGGGGGFLSDINYPLLIG